MNTDKFTSEFILRGKRPRIANTVSKEKNKVRGLMRPKIKAYNQDMVTKTRWYW